MPRTCEKRNTNRCKKKIKAPLKTLKEPFWSSWRLLRTISAYRWQIRGNMMPSMAIHGNPSRYGGRGVQYLSTSRSSSGNLNLTPNLRHQDKLRLPPSLGTYHDLSGFTMFHMIKMDQTNESTWIGWLPDAADFPDQSVKCQWFNW